MPSTTGYKYPLPGNGYGLGKLPPIRRKKMDRQLTCIGRVWIFLILGVVLIVLGLVSVGVYFNMDAITMSSEYMEVMPPLVNCGAILLSGLCVCLLFWKRLKALVLIAVVVCIASGLLCGITAVLNTTHVLQPIQSFTSCRYYLSQKLCQCFSPYKRDMLSLDFSENDLTKYDFIEAGSCESIQEVLPQLLYTIIAVYGVVLLVSFGSAILALLVLRIETNKRSCFQDENYEEVYTVSGSSSQDQSDSEVEVIAASLGQGQGSSNVTAGKTPSRRESNSGTLNSNRSGIPSVNSNRSGGPQSQNIGRSATSSQNSLPQVTNTKTLQSVQRAKTPAQAELARESLASRYMISEIPDREVTYRQRLSKTPDREVGSRRRNSISNFSKRLSKSCDSLESSGRESPDKQGFWDTGTGIVVKGKGKLKEHRRKGKRAATVHTLDRDQLLLILNLQMRYLQETQDKESQQRNSQIRANSRRAVTPQPSSQKTVIPQKVRSHTPQPYKYHQREKDPKEREFYDQIETLLFRSKQKEQQRLSNQNESGWGKRTRNFSDTSNSNTNVLNGNLSGGVTQQRSVNSSDLINTNSKFQPGSESYLTSQQIYNSTRPSQGGHRPYTGPGYNSADSVHYITYADTMLSKQSKKPITRASVQNCTLPPEPLHRGMKHSLPPQPLSRQYGIINQPLPPQPIHRGQSAFQIVDRSSKSRSPSVASDRNDLNTTLQKTLRTDQADIAIRENFQMNPSPFMLQNSQIGVRSAKNSSANPNAGFVCRRDQTPPTEILPPYSGPPSYNEYVSSCEHSVTSSLSSNPDDIYSMPSRRVQQDNEQSNHNYGHRIPTNQMPAKSLNSQMAKNAGEHIYGNSETFGQTPNGFTNNNVDRSTGKSDHYYSSPSRSRVKQFIVPEDYYTPIHKIQQQKERTKIQNTPVPVPTSQKGHVVQTGRGQGYDPDYGNVNNNPGRFTQSYTQNVDHQIAPDAQYHEYEDVYERVQPPRQVPSDNIGQNLPSSSHQYQRPGSARHQPHPLNTHGFNETPNLRKKMKKKSKDKSPMKSNPSYTVSNVNAKVLNFVDHGEQELSVSAGVQNVHAENVNSIPKIRINNVDTDDDDDVFTDGDLYSNNREVLKGQNNNNNIQNFKNVPEQQSQNRNHGNSQIQTEHQFQYQNHGSSQFQMENECQYGNHGDPRIQNEHQNPYKSHGNSQNQNRIPSSQEKLPINDQPEVSDSGYMKMTLPASSVAGEVTVTNENDAFNPMTGMLTNQNTEPNEREVPDGNEAESEGRSESECEETGV